MSDLPTRIRAACAAVAERARSVRIVAERIPEYAASLPPAPPPRVPAPTADDEQTAAFWLTLDAINFGSGWFPTLRKPSGLSGYRTVEKGIRERFATRGPWNPPELAALGAAEIARTLDQDPEHELMALFAGSLNDLGRHIGALGSFTAVVDGAGGSAIAVTEQLAGWDCFADVSCYDGRDVPFYKRAQIAGFDLAGAGLPITHDLDRLTIFADNLVPHVLRLDGVLAFAPELVDRIER